MFYFKYYISGYILFVSHQNTQPLNQDMACRQDHFLFIEIVKIISFQSKKWVLLSTTY